MALVQAPPTSAEPHNPGFGGGPRRRHPSSSSPPTNAPPSTLDPMGSVSSIIAPPRPAHYHDHRSVGELGARIRRPPATASCLGVEPPLDSLLLHSSTASIKGLETEGGNYTYLNEVYIGDWNDNHVPRASPGSDADETKGSGLNGNMGGPPPKLIPVSGKLEKNMEKTVLRPTAFKAVIPRSRGSMQYLSPRHCAKALESQSNLNLLSPTHIEGSPSCSDKSSSYSRVRGGGSSGHSCQLTDSGRNSLTSLPPYGSGGYGLASGEASGGHLEPTRSGPPAGGHGHTNSDSGRSSSSKSTGSGSMSGRGQPLSDSGSGGRSPGPAEGYEVVVRDLEDKLRERELELQQLRENLDENEAAICQVYEEKQKRFELELEELRQGCATRMQVASQKAQRAQQVLQLQLKEESVKENRDMLSVLIVTLDIAVHVYQLQQEKKKLQEDFSQLLKEREQLEQRCTSFEHEQIQLGPRLEESEWEVSFFQPTHAFS
ncbi:Leucine zipper putative tumor suppressor 2 [Liparis tanakae]|uniref:Leucine zipper putative tumor suppressor 2 n=1 Tax=Liparis tanakae TaxID=230148 RepID=A0A4Z2J482_9TELE|nr:Leucine zipper putative tumor suppressor 2 [Liparis tanakae]